MNELLGGSNEAITGGIFLPVPPLILLQPISQWVHLGDLVSLNVLAVGTGPLSYQWRVNGNAIPSATNAILSLRDIQIGQSGSYTVAISNPAGTVFSAAATLIVDSTPFPFSDNVADASQANSFTGTALGSNLGATREEGEPLHAGRNTTRSVWLRWRAPATGIVTFNTLGSSFDTVLAAYSGDAGSNLTTIAASDDASSLTSRIQFNTLEGELYYLAVDAVGGAGGAIALSWNLEETTDRLPAIISLTRSQTVGAGEPVAFSVLTDVTGALFQWFLNDVALLGETNSSLNLIAATPENVGAYSVKILYALRQVVSETIDLQINDTDGGVARDVAARDKFVDAVQWTSPNRLKGRAKRGTAARGYTGSQIFSTVGSGKEPGEPDHCGIPGGASEWFAWQCPTNGTAVLTTDGSNFDTVLAVYTGPGTDFASLVVAACDNDSGTNGRTSRVSFNATAGTIYYIAVDGVNGASGTVRLSFAVGSVPEITVQPLAQTAPVGGAATFSVAVSAFPNVRYQWNFEGAELPGATNSILTLSPVEANRFGRYHVRVANSIGAALSIPAPLVLEVPLQITSRAKHPGGFHLSIAGPAGADYVLDCSTNLADWLPITTNRARTGLFEHRDASASSNACLFYRVRALP